MSSARKFASGLLRAVARRAPSGSREWAAAMLRELDFIENDWAALLWALGSAAAIFGHPGKAWFGRKSSEEERQMNEIGKKTVGLLAGVGVAALLILCAIGAVLLSIRFFPGVGPGRIMWTHWLAIISVETIFVIAAVKLWRKRAPMAVGILLSGIVLAAHVVIHMATH
jgi:hypothetical protein